MPRPPGRGRGRGRGAASNKGALIENLQNIVPPEEEDNDDFSHPVDLQSVTANKYLRRTVVPILTAGLNSLIKERPEDPLTYLATFLREHKEEFENVQAISSPKL